MKIIVIGAPGSGKSRFAKALNQQMEPSRGGHLVDGYISRLTKRTGLPYDIYANYVGNLQLAYARLTAEQENRDEFTIVVGSVYETILYTALRIEWDWERADTKTAKETVNSYGRTVMQSLGMLESFNDFDVAFFLPYSEKKRLEKGHSYDTVINEKLPEILTSYWKRAVALEGTTKQKVADAIEIIRRIETSLAERQPVRRGPETGSEGPEVPGRVSNLPLSDAELRTENQRELLPRRGTAPV